MTYLLPRLASCEVCGGGLAFRLFLETELPLIHPETIVFFFSSIILGSILTWEGGRMKEKKERKDKTGNKRGREEKTKDTSSSGLPEQNTADLMGEAGSDHRGRVSSMGAGGLGPSEASQPNLQMVSSSCVLACLPHLLALSTSLPSS